MACFHGSVKRIETSKTKKGQHTEEPEILQKQTGGFLVSCLQQTENEQRDFKETQNQSKTDYCWKIILFQFTKYKLIEQRVVFPNLKNIIGNQ